jgi:hypothetical protein
MALACDAPASDDTGPTVAVESHSRTITPQLYENTRFATFGILEIHRHTLIQETE